MRGTLFHNTFVRYLFAIVLVASTFALRLWLIPLTGIGAPFVLFFAAVLVISVAAGIGPGICAIVLSVPLDAYMFAARAGYPPFQASGQGLLFAVDGIDRHLSDVSHEEGASSRAGYQEAKKRILLREANEQITRSMTQTREVIELRPTHSFRRISMPASPTSTRPHAGCSATIGTSCLARQSSRSFRSNMGRG